jgi:hypothetical protein
MAARLASALLVLTGIAAAQSPEDAARERQAVQLRERRDKKLEQPFVSNVPWVRDFDQAVRKAREERKPILAYFTISLAPSRECEALEETVLASAEFRELAAAVVPYLNLRTGLKEDDREAGLIFRKGGRDRPYFAFLDDEGGFIVEHPPRTASVPALRKMLDTQVKGFFDLRGKARAGDAEATIELTILEARIGRIPPAEIGRRLEGATLTAAQQEALTEARALAALGEARKRLAASRGERAAVAAAGRVLAEAYGSGALPRERQPRQEFLSILFQYAVDVERDPALAEKALAELKPVMAQMLKGALLERWIKAAESRIADLRAPKGEGSGDGG